MSTQADMMILKSQFQLTEGKHEDFYQLHSTWCVTKKGAHKIAQAANIKMEVQHCDITSVSIAYRGAFSYAPDKGSTTTIEEIGSCRWDSGKKNPECTHAPEMAWKRLHVRGVLALVAPGSGIYGADEMTSDWHQQGNSQPSPITQPQSQANPVQQQAPAGDAPEWAAKVPSEWNMLMGKIAENCHQTRAEFEPIILNAATLREWEGKLYDSQTKYGSFDGFFNGTTNAGKPLYGSALSCKKKADEWAKDLSAGKPLVLTYNAGGTHAQYTIEPRSGSGPPRTGEPETGINPFPDDVPF